MASFARAWLGPIALGAVLLGGAPVAAEPAATLAGAPAAALAAPVKTTLVYVIRRTPDAWTVMDPAAIERVPGGVVRRAWSVTVRRNLLDAGEPHPGYVRTFNEYDCGGARVRWRTFTIYNRFGAVVLTQDNPTPIFGPATPGSEQAASLQVVCEGGGGGSAVAAPSLGQLVIGLMQAWDEATPPAITPPGPAKPDAKKADPKRPAAKKPPAKPAKKPAAKKHTHA
jgi:hypothetical protein